MVEGIVESFERVFLKPMLWPSLAVAAAAEPAEIGWVIMAEPGEEHPDNGEQVPLMKSSARAAGVEHKLEMGVKAVS
jgi:hypothetical protein